jgi:Ca-activated chloride channel homolog
MGLYALNEKKEEVMIPLKNVSVKARIDGGISCSEFKLDFFNTFCKEPVEVTFEFPIENHQVVKKLSAKIGERTVETKVRDIEKAKEIYSKAIAGGKAAVFGKTGPKDESLSLVLGNLMPQ